MGGTAPAVIKIADLMPLVSILGAVFVFYGAVRARLLWATERRSLGRLGTAFWLIDYLPNLTLAGVALAGVFSAVSYFVHLAWPEAGGPWFHPIIQWNATHWFPLFFLWLGSAALAQLNLIPRVTVWSLKLLSLTGYLPSLTFNIGVINAWWHVTGDDKARAAALTGNGTQLAQEIVDHLVSAEANASLTTRPPGLSDAEAANVLYFGHVVEAIQSTGGLRTFTPGWAAFYAELGRIAALDGKPFAPTTIRKIAADRFFHTAMQQYAPPDNTGDASLPTVYALESAIEQACGALQNLPWRGDARKLARVYFGLFRYSRQKAVRRAAAILEQRGLQLQFGNLCLLWRVWGKDVAPPGTFEPPFSRGITLLMLERTFINTDADQLDTTDPYVRGLVRCAEIQILRQAGHILERSNSTAISAWTTSARQKAAGDGLQWDWYLYYRLGQRLYQMGRDAKPTRWEIRPNGTVIGRKR